ncbi:carbohydrate ABC transporter permease [Streptomyces sp. TS71-3]|uniref:carbohydrate ABC transporter permease n=1 Tax=Streptomyces sp. TS71-3 TaxID=2733862 RepID=UPI001B17EFD4|nr:sugar ABC transporter permease [Streptomyces sp. TS71-3]GHJ39342.1 ABC transporter permease [Streptomyces sp. TS71-3]
MTTDSLAPSVTGAPESFRPRRRRGRSGSRDSLAALGFLTPWLIGMACLTLGPMAYSLYLSFTRYDLLSSPRWVGLANFTQLFSDPRFDSAAWVTIMYVVVSVPVVLVVSMLVALLLNTGIRFITGYRALIYLPSLLGASVAIATLWRQIFGASGLLNNALQAIGIEHRSWIGDPNTSLLVIITLNAWAFGSTMVIFLAGLRQVPRDQLEAALVDGAGPFRRFFSVTLPHMSPLVFFSVLLDTVHAFQAFTSAYVVSGGDGGPADSTLFYTLYLYQQGFTQLNMGYASAMAWFLVVVLAAFTGVLFLTSRFWVHYGDR